jgi:hypothetical protein
MERQIAAEEHAIELGETCRSVLDDGGWIHETP